MVVKTRSSLDPQATAPAEGNALTMPLEVMQVSMAVHVLDGRIAAANPAAQEISGSTHAETTGKNSTDPIWLVVRETGVPLVAPSPCNWGHHGK